MLTSKDLLKILFDTNVTNTTCFMCFKQTEDPNDIYDNIEIWAEDCTVNISIWNILNSILPSLDTPIKTACNECCDLIIKFYITIQKCIKNNKLLENILSPLQINLERSLHENFIDKSKMFISLKNHHNSLQKDPSQIDGIINAKKTVKNKNIPIYNNSLICHICGKLCKSKLGLKSHLNCHKFKQCPFCMKSLKNHSHYKLHVRSHSCKISKKNKTTYYICNKCDYRTVCKSNLDAHNYKMHLKIRPHICDVCLKGFYSKSNLVEHKLIHNDSKKATCEICGDNFVSNKTLKQHLKLHNNDKSYKCSFCNKSFVNSGRRTDHVKRNHLEKNLRCTLCDKKFNMRRDLKKHFKTVHQQDLKCVSDIESCSVDFLTNTPCVDII